MSALKNYIRQKTENNCGPVAVYNFLVWANQNPKKTDMRLIRKLLGTSKKGTDLNSVLNFLNLFTEAFDIRYFSTRSMTKPLSVLQAGGGFFIIFAVGSGIPHVSFCRGVVNGKISLINAVSARKELLVTKTEFKNLLKNTDMVPIFITTRKK